MKPHLAACVFGLLLSTPCYPQCSDLSILQALCASGAYDKALALADQAKKNCEKKYEQPIQQLKVDCLIELDSSSAQIDAAVKDLLENNPQFDTRANGVSPDLAHYIAGYDIYSKLNVGITAGVPLWLAPAHLQSEPVYSRQSGSSYHFSRWASAAYAVHVEYFVRRHWSMEAGYQLLNYAYQRNLRFDDASVRYRENLSYQGLQTSISYYPGWVKGFRLSVGYTWSMLTDATGEIYSSWQRYENGIDQSARRTRHMHSASLAVGTDLFAFMNQRATVSTQVRWAHGFSPVNRDSRRYENASLTEQYYYSDDRFRLNAVCIELCARYKVYYHIKTYN